MAPDPLQQAWQAESSQPQMTVDTDRLLKSVHDSQARLRATILGRDIREVGTALVMVPLWIIMGYLLSLPWTWYLGVPASLWVAGFILIDRKRHPQRAVTADEPLVESAQESLRQVEHQIWLLRNVFWWYLLPSAVSISAFFAQVFWSTWRASPPTEGLETVIAVGCFIFIFAVLFGVYGFIYFINQQAVRLQLEPHRQELLRLLASLNEESADCVEGEYPFLTGPDLCVASPRRMVVAGLVAVAVVLATVSGILYLGHRVDEHFNPKKSPFAAVRWQQSQPEVKVGEEWFTLVSLDGLSASDIVEFSRRTYRDLWQKRFEEDLVDVLTGMGHRPGNTVRLVVTPIGSQETRTLEGVRMTRANRDAIWNAGRGRVRQAPVPSATHSSVHTGDADEPLTKLVVRLRSEKKLVGLAAMVMVDGRIVAAAADGERKIGSGVWVEAGDRWHLGGLTKPITATMIARLIESGRMKWSETVGERFPGATIHDDWMPVTVHQLLTDSAGAPASFSREIMLKKPALGPESTAARREAVLQVIAEKPVFPPGQRSAYSNVGYTIAGAMAEAATGERWEDLVRHEVYEPLKLADAGFGPPRSDDALLENPQGHLARSGVKVAFGDMTDNTFIMGPAGIAHMSLRDLCTFTTEHLRGESGMGQLLPADVYKRLHTIELNRYACGWLKKEPSAEIPHALYWHNGSNTMWYALAVFIPEKNMVVAVTSNDGDTENAEAAAWGIVKASIGLFGAGVSSTRDRIEALVDDAISGR
ncbi:D-alanyl-D-alanine carboxypeptidase precursor [Caulifigura coniformis]|uniref:D-alanyl-D-alanine carboxypeptidase n=1 Tax=Caulifigura coniformis TaxID=2527983 RepID=A0A517SLX4_9PLAN|nr:serine hydrolase domain-containing protein [Caulifigura coniformis]QDT57124.1 D-alanyl-D-alanine carboxypeptidase precursor [Caulifigura coniformis]